MLRTVGLLLLTPLFVVAFALRLAVFMPFAVLFLVPVLIMRPRLVLRAPRMFRYMLMAKRGERAGCGPNRRWPGSHLDRAVEPIKL